MKVMMVLLLVQLLGTMMEDGAVGGRGDARWRRSGGGKERGRPSVARTERAIEEGREGAGQAVGGEDRDGEAGRGGRRATRGE